VARETVRSRRPVARPVRETPTKAQTKWRALLNGAKAAKPSKYRNRKTEVDGITFDSAKEARRWQELKMLEKAGKIARLKRQQHFELCAPFTNLRGDVKDFSRIAVVSTYVADFTYDALESGATKFVVEDVKGMRTSGYRGKKRHFERQYGMTILET
jgi:hypothetical protein